MARQSFNKEQRRYIKSNYKTLSLEEMAKQLKCDVRDIEEVLKEMDMLDEGPIHKAIPLRVLNRQDWLWGIPAFLLPVLIFTMTLCRSLYVGDSGEFSAQGAVLGIAHPPGYPMWVLMLKCAVILFKPFFTHEAARGAFLCALVAGAATYFLYILLLKLSHYRTVALTGSLMFAFCYHFWSQALFSEVFILNVFFTVVTMLLMLVWSETQENRYLLALYFVTALAMAHHNLFLVMPLLYSYFIVCTLFRKWDVKKEVIYFFIYGVVGLILYVIAGGLANLISLMVIRQPMPIGDTFGTKFVLVFLTFVPYTMAFHWWHKRDKTWIYATLLFILGLSMYLYIPMRVAGNPVAQMPMEERRQMNIQNLNNPAMSWGYPETVEDIYNHISRRQYGPLSPIPRVSPAFLGNEAIFGPWDIVQEQFAEYWIYFFRQFGSFKPHFDNQTLDHFNRQFLPHKGSFGATHQGLIYVWTLIWVALMALGIRRLFKQNGKYFMLSLGAFMMYGPGMLAVLNYQTTNHSMYIIARFLIPSYLIASIWIAFGSQQILEWFKYGFQMKGLPPIPHDYIENGKSAQVPAAAPDNTNKAPMPLPVRYAGCALMMAMPLVPLSMNYWHQNLSRNNVAYDFGMNILNSITPDSKIFIIGDNPTFSLAYLSYVEKKFNPDQIYDEGENIFVPIFDFGKDKFRIPPWDHNRLKDIGRAKITMTSKTPVYYMSVQDTNPPQDDPNRYASYPDFTKVRQLPSGIVYQAVRPGEAEPDYDATLQKMKPLDPYFYEMSTDYYTRELVSNYHFLLGRAYYQSAEKYKDNPAKMAEVKKKAFEEFQKTSETGWDLDNMHINLANIYRAEGMYDKAIEEFNKAIETQPRKAISYFQLADLYRVNNRPEEAIAKLKKGISLSIYDPQAADPTARYLLGMLEVELANKIRKDRDASLVSGAEKTKMNNYLTDAIPYLQDAIASQQDNFSAYQNLGEAYYHLGDYENAVAMWQKAVQINPGFYPAYLNLSVYYRQKANNPAKAQEYSNMAMRAMQTSGGQANMMGMAPKLPAKK
jgi:tetratricopeptide (TPR) repeat protein